MKERCAVFAPVNEACPPMALYSTIPLQQESEDAMARFSLRAGESVTFVFGAVRSGEQQPEMERWENGSCRRLAFGGSGLGNQNTKGAGGR